MDERFEVVEMAEGPQGVELILWSEVTGRRQLLRFPGPDLHGIALGDELVATPGKGSANTVFVRIALRAAPGKAVSFAAEPLTSRFGQLGWQVVAGQAPERPRRKAVHSLGEFIVSRKPKAGRVA